MPEDIIKDPPIAPPTDKPGYTTSEFWLTLVGAILSFVTALLTLLTPGFKLDPQVQTVVVAAAPLAAMIGTAFYSISRSRSKAAAATIVTTKMGLDFHRETQQSAWDLAAAQVAFAPATTRIMKDK